MTDDSFRIAPPGNDRVYNHNAMSAFPQEKNSHYTTAYDDATTSLTEHIYRYILRGGLILSDSRIYVY